MEQKPLWQWGGLNLVAALSVVECLLPMLHPEKAPHLAIKWPNDVLWQSHKLAGILTECVHTQHHNALLLGIGINLLAPTQVPQAVGLSSLLKSHVDHTIDTLTPLALWKRLEKVLLPHWHMFRQWGFAPFVASYTHYDALFQKSIHFEEKGQRQTACANGVDDYGRLKVNYADGRSALCASGEVQQITRP
jgi:BirA family biotin operon repressor/biotin-[acetyl-CoA-carboxylase] ligase